MRNAPYLTEGYAPTLAMQIARTRPGRRIGQQAARSAQRALTVITWGTGDKFRTRPAMLFRQGDTTAAQNFSLSPAGMARSCPSAPSPVATSRRETTTHIEGSKAI